MAEQYVVERDSWPKCIYGTFARLLQRKAAIARIKSRARRGQRVWFGGFLHAGDNALAIQDILTISFQFSALESIRAKILGNQI